MLRASLTQFVRTYFSTSHRRRGAMPVVGIEHLETRSLMSASAAMVHDHDHESADIDHSLEGGDEPPLAETEIVDESDGGGTSATTTRSPLSSLPLLDSNPNAAVQLYLDFNGHVEPSWKTYRNVTSPVFSLDEDRTTFSDWELATIREIWSGVAEDYAPFNINVTTVDRGDFSNGRGLRVVIGGSPFDWYRLSCAGTSSNNSFTSSEANVAYVFPDYYGVTRGVGRLADVVSHEAGHSFGLVHQSQYDANGNFVDCYRRGDRHTSPIMGAGGGQRSVWAVGASTSATRLQDDIAVLGRASNGFGERPDDHGDLATSASELTRSNGQWIGGGLITKGSDQDVFHFRTEGGTAVFAISNNLLGANLIVRSELRDASGRTIASAIGTDTDPACLSANLPAGDYWIVVSNNGEYGSLGAYSIRGTVTLESANSVQAPTSWRVNSHFGNRLELSWSAVAGAAGYRIYRREKAGQPESLVATLPASQSQITLPSLRTSAVWNGEYRIESFNARGAAGSSWIVVTHDFKLPMQTGRLELQPLSDNSVRLTWRADSTAHFQKLIVSRDTSDNRYVRERFVLLPANQTELTLTGLSSGQRYSFTLKGVTPAGYRGTSTNFTMPHPEAPAAPQSLQWTRMANRVVELSWAAVNGATGYRVYSQSETGMRLLTPSPITATTFRTTSLSYNTQHQFIVEAVNAKGATQARFETIQFIRTPPTAITSLQATAVTNRSVTLTWADSQSETGYRIRRLSGSENTELAVLNANSTSYTATDLAPNTAYRFQIIPFNDDGTATTVINVRTMIDPPSAIRNFTAATVSSSAVQLTWADSTGETRYSVYRINGTTGRQLVRTLSANSTSYRVTGLTARTTYRFILVASNAAGTVESEMITGTTLA